MFFSQIYTKRFFIFIVFSTLLFAVTITFRNFAE